MTRNELYRAVLERLQVAADGEPAQPEDIAKVAGRYDDIFEMLSTRDFTNWHGSDIPADAGLAVTMVVAAYVAEDFFLPEKRKNDLKVEGFLDLPVPSVAERMLKRRLAAPYISSRVKTEYF
jgi:hypothetical protein